MHPVIGICGPRVVPTPVSSDFSTSRVRRIKARWSDYDPSMYCRGESTPLGQMPGSFPPWTLLVTSRARFAVRSTIHSLW
ncbi:hypothetical protein FA13DRAFT_323584 [Coprinellus micaceus]|uniref:Uncharacterized protein n=1 Tax=Coprinellus micaceus TaxID=71717 RepID=A0A4Y7SDF2_COPMI|nr:hypothetical protein FA13DRAFT_323584 [Coprinellus micaceus]